MSAGVASGPVNALPKAALQEGEGSLWQSFYCTSQDGLRLHNRLYGSPLAGHLPVVCLAGLTRNGVDFHEIATALSTHRSRPRMVLAMDYRGRGRSEYDSDPGKYDIRVELQDVQDVMTACGIHQAVFIGTSRGGIISMGLSAVRPACIRGVVLNDIGGIIEGKGLARIKSYVGKLPKPADYTEAVAILKRIASQHFTRLSAADWETFARRSFKETPAGLAPDYDPRLMKSLEEFDLEKPLPPLWQYFDGLRGFPVLSIRGENSDLFSAETQAEMTRRHPHCEAYVVPGEGHAPLLADRATIRKVTSFIHGVEDGRFREA
ncbi:MAG: alpha/beta hydrolase [Methylocystis sp.]|nr:alpha/beta hydrolase [Methylocystis sp.]MCA3583476.1 alpha/beta hydrolase [Methylocystis sp.]MCA3587846.1 alpha/beta hydrolase [Methylocystis sp.]MCA3592771.1 alpha/beta hydrolase [Methylocystis sp.]